ncbi:hypothetical protein DLAC_02644 [Tieghemostelium lacteum]|uniref:Rhodanese domain-containing protein n=1 Tax=Tieghemostelium lacteum TaxID=361077 RepID=A0A152A332_TIELA|nr:hypothetical protein DLAC_02644 [Tieghemostelium lacteum]|eukprot:KYR00620.1 hypothetical protein DLAC_02644 [Tieghemostelium lacteum]
MLLIRSSSRLLQNNFKNIVVQSTNKNGAMFGGLNRYYSTDVDAEEDSTSSKKSKKSSKKVDEAKAEEDTKSIKTESLDADKLASGANKKKLLKPRHNKVRPEIELQREYIAPLSVQEEDELSQNKITIKEIKEIIEQPSQKEVFIIDLRDPKEFFADSPIKASYNMPMEYQAVEKVETSHKGTRGKKGQKQEQAKKSVNADSELDFWQKVSKLTPMQWKEKFGFPKITPQDQIVFYSANQGRSKQATQMALNQGFKSTRYLVGGIRLFNKYYNN